MRKHLQRKFVQMLIQLHLIPQNDTKTMGTPRLLVPLIKAWVLENAFTALDAKMGQELSQKRKGQKGRTAQQKQLLHHFAPSASTASSPSLQKKD